MTIHIPIRARFDAALDALLREAYREGLDAGLHTADKIVGWLSRLPDTKRQAETREWAEKIIAQAREEK